jgi:hypothetical protein
MKLDPLLVQRLGFVGRGFAVDRAVLGLAVMDLARLFGEFRTDVVGVLGNVVAGAFEGSLEGDVRLGSLRRC